MTQLAHIAARRTGFRNRRETLLVSAAVGMALALMPATDEAHAQNSFGAFQGTPTFNPNQVDIQQSTNTTTVTLKAPVATITWTPFNNEGTGPIDFLPQGLTGVFQNDPTIPNFAVLNRIVPADASRRVDFNGRVVSQLRDSAGTVTGPGGSVAFYAPGGIFVSSTAVFDVGSLLLTTLDPLRDGSGNFLGAGGNLSLRGAPGTTAQVVTQPGSQINATANGSTVAMVAAQVIHQGSVRVNGSAAYIAAESVDVVVNNGLFDINILTGTSRVSAITHTGTTGGPASTGAGDNQKIYMVAVPKNQAITMTLSGSAGFDPATSATVENGEIVLSAGASVIANGFSVAGSIPADAVIDGGTFSSDVRAFATNDAAVRTTAGSDVTFVQDVTLLGGQRAFIAAENGRTINVFGNATVSNARSGAEALFNGVGTVPTFGSEATIQATGANSLVDIRGTATLNASVQGFNDTSATGGRAEIFAAQSGRVEVDGAVNIGANGQAGGTTTGQDGQDGTGGRAAVQASGGGTVTLGGTALVQAQGFGGTRLGGTDAASGTGTGGTAMIEGASGTVTVANTITVNAQGNGGGTAAAGNGGLGVGGTALVVASNGGTVNLNGAGAGSVSAIGRGGLASQSGQGGGDGTGGRAQVSATSAGTINATQALSISAAGVGGNGVAATGGNGGVGRGGQASLSAVDGRVNFNTASIFASGTGGAGAAGGAGFGGGAGMPLGEAAQPGAFVVARRGQVVGTSVQVNASGFGGAGSTGAGGNATGGSAAVTGFNGSAVDDNVPQDGPSLVDIDTVTVTASASGGTGGLSSQGVGQAGGNAVGGQANLTAQAINGNVDVVTANLNATAFGGQGGNASSGGLSGGAGGTAAGGRVTVGQVSGGSDTPDAAKAGSARYGSINASANGIGGNGGRGGSTGGNGTGGVGGNATGGAAVLLARGAALTVTGTANLNALGQGGQGALDGAGSARANGGRGAGGDAVAAFTPFFNSVTNSVTTAGATVNVGTLNLNANGSRSVALPTGVGLEPDQWGTIQLDVIRSTANIGSATLRTNGETGRDLAAIGLTSSVIAPTNAPNFVRAEAGALNFTLANNGFGSLAADLAGDLEFAAVGTGTIRADNQIDARVSGLLSFTHAGGGEGAVAVAAPVMFFTSSRIEVGGSVGDADTDLINLFADEQLNFPAVFGGDTEEAGYTLTRSEAALLQADNISIQVDRIFDEDPNRTEVLIRDITLQGTATGDGTAFIDLFADGIVRIEGKVDFVNASAADVLAIGSDTRLELITPTGGIRMTAPDGSLSGLLALDSSRIVVADSALAARLAADPNFEGRTEALRTNNGPVNPAGYLEAGGIIIETDGEGGAEGVYIQNTGTATEFAGLTVGAAGLFIDSEDVGPIDLVGFGRRDNGDGTFTTGNAFFAQVDFGTTSNDVEEQPTTYTAASEFNGCNVNNGCGDEPPPPPPPGMGAFAGTPSFDEARVTIARGDALDTITIKAPTAIINWTPTDNQGSGPINFLPQGHTGIFQNDTSITNFAVLNRIVPADASRRVDFNGRVVSQLRDASGNVTGPGGTVAFYSPGGIFVSSSAVFDVGSLLLTSMDPILQQNGSFFDANGRYFLRGPAGNTAPIITAAGSQINALSEGSFVALVSPRLEIGGAVRVNGSADYVAAESVDLSPGVGLTLLRGTGVATPLIHTGSTTGPASSSRVDAHRITMVAAAKDQAITATVSGTVGFDAPANPAASNNQIVFSAGYDVGGFFRIEEGSSSGVLIPTIGQTPLNTTAANFVVNGGNFTSNVLGRATTDFFIASPTATPDFAGDVNIRGGARAHIASRVAGETLSIGGNVIISTDAGSFDDSVQSNSQAGESLLYAQNGGRLTIGGNAAVLATAIIRPGSTPDRTATGGQARIFAEGGSAISVAGSATASADGLASVLAGQPAATQASASGIGGQALVLATGGSTITTGGLNVTARGGGQLNVGNASLPSGSGRGGRAEAGVNTGGSLTVNGSMAINADGQGGSVRGAGQTGVGSSRVDLQACKLEYSIVSPK